MQTVNCTATRGVWKAAFAGLVVLMTASSALAASGTWIVNGGGDYNTSTSWQGGVVASGAGFTADFSTLDITGDHDVTLNTPLTIGHLAFGDTNQTGGSWGFSTTSLATAIITLDNGGASPTITANPMAGGFDNAFIGNNIAGTAGFTKLGAGVLELGGGNTHTLTGGIRVDAGTLRLLSLFPAQPYSLAGGTTLQLIGGTGGTANAANAATIAAGQTATVRQTTAGSMMGISGTGSTLNYVLVNNGLNEMWSNWAANGNLAQINISTDPSVGAAGLARLDINRNPNPFNGAAFANTVVNIDNAVVYTRTNSFGNTVPIGELRGTTTGVLRGGNAGSAARYEIGGMNTSSTFSGVIDGTGGISLNKVGTGTLTLAGTFQGDTTNNSLALAGNSLARQGGVIRVTAGSLKLTGASAIPGGFGTVLTTIDVLPGATFDVTSTPSTFATAALQKIQGGGTVLGNYNHAAGRIQPGDVGAATAANEGNLSAGVVPTAGTLTFNGNLTLGGGDIVYDMSLNPNAGNDLVHVTGSTALNSGKITPNFFAGIPSSGTYTVLTSAGGFTGSAANITVDFPGRGADPVAFISGNALQFTAAAGGGSANLVWTGATNSNWDVETTQNWNNGGSPDVFFNLDVVTFNESAANKAVTVAATVSPTSVTIDNTSDYTFTGGGAIVGTTGLTKTGTGALTMNVNNTFTGPANVSNSTVNVANFSGLGTGALTLNNATYVGTVSIPNASVDIPAGTTSTIQIDGAATAGSAANLPTLTGDGTVNLTSTVNDRYFGTGNTAGFTGTLNVAPSGGATLLGRVRIRAGQTNLSNAVVNLTAAGMSNQQGAAADSMVTVGIGELHGDSSATLVAFEGGSTPPDITWQIGALDTNSNFDGVISDGAGSGGDASIAHIAKIGTGTLTLSNLNTYTGATRVEGGVLSIAQPYLADTADVFVSGGGKFDLNFGGTDTIDSLYLNGVPQAPGVYGLSGLGSAFFTGTGLLQVTTLGAPLGVTGDYNGDGTVDAADYTVWRDNLGGNATALLNRDPNNAGVVSQADYDSWKANFGQMFGAGSLDASGAVPEPSSMVIAAMCGLLIAGGCNRPRR